MTYIQVLIKHLTYKPWMVRESAQTVAEVNEDAADDQARGPEHI